MNTIENVKRMFGDDVILAPCIRILPIYTNEKANFSVDKGNILIFKCNNGWSMKNKLHNKHSTVWFSDTVNKNYVPDDLDKDVYYIIHKDEYKSDEVIENSVDFHQYVLETLNNVTSSRTDYSRGKYKKATKISDDSSFTSNKREWDYINVSIKKVKYSTLNISDIRRDVHRMMVEIYLPHFKNKLRSLKDGYTLCKDMAPDQIGDEYDDNSSIIYISRASMCVQ